MGEYDEDIPDEFDEILLIEYQHEPDSSPVPL